MPARRTQHKPVRGERTALWGVGPPGDSEKTSVVLRIQPSSEKAKTMPEPEQERSARQAHIGMIEAGTRKERAKAEERSGIDKEVEDELQTVQPGAKSTLPRWDSS